MCFMEIDRSSKFAIPIKAMPITVLLVEDVEPIRMAIKRILKTEPAIKRVGKAASFAQAVKKCAELGRRL